MKFGLSISFSLFLARIRGIVVEEDSGRPVIEGSIVIRSDGYFAATVMLEDDGSFEIPSLLPG